MALLLNASICLAADSTEKVLLFTDVVEDTFHITVDCYPQALPNDGRSEAEISVTLTDGTEPVPDSTIRAEIVTGDGTLTYSEAVTDSDGIAVFPFRSGLMTQATEVSFAVAEQDDVQTSLSIPLAPVTYLDVLLVEPEEYEAYIGRQVSAAPIYSMTTDLFPDQLAADGGSMSLITARLQHVDGSSAAGVPLVVQIVSGEGTIQAEQVATDSGGEFSFHYIAGFTPGTVSVAVIEPSTGLVKMVDIILVEAGPARVQMFYMDPVARGLQLEGAILPADGVTGLPVTAVVTDLSGIPLSGIELDVSVLDEGNGWLELIDPVSDISGQVRFIYYSGTSTGPVRLRAYIAGGMDLAPPEDMLLF